MEKTLNRAGATVTTSGGVQETETSETKWSSQNASIASITTGGMVTAVAVGATTIDGLIEWPEEGEVACFPSSCHGYTYEGEAPTNVLSATKTVNFTGLKSAVDNVYVQPISTPTC